MDSYNENLNVSNTAADTGADHEAPDAAAVFETLRFSL